MAWFFSVTKNRNRRRSIELPCIFCEDSDPLLEECGINEEPTEYERQMVLFVDCVSHYYENKKGTTTIHMTNGDYIVSSIPYSIIKTALHIAQKGV